MSSESPAPIDIPPPNDSNKGGGVEGEQGPYFSGKHHRSQTISDYPVPATSHSRQGSGTTTSESLLTRLSRLGFSPPKGTPSGLSQLVGGDRDKERWGGNGQSDTSESSNGSGASSNQGALSHSPASSVSSGLPSTPPHNSSTSPSLLPSLFPSAAKSLPIPQSARAKTEFDGVENALADSSSDLGGGERFPGGGSPFGPGSPEQYRPTRRASVGPSGMLFGSGRGDEPASPTSGLGIFRRMSLSGGFGRPALAPISTSPPTSSSGGQPFSPSSVPYPAAPPPTPQTGLVPLPSSPYNDTSRPLPALPEDDRARSPMQMPAGVQRKGSKRDLSPMSRRMLRGPWHD